MSRRGSKCITLILILCILGAALALNSPLSPGAGFGQVTTTIVIVTTVPLVVTINASTCVIIAGVLQPDGTIVWLPGLAYPDLPPSQCPETLTGPYTDTLGRSIMFHQTLQYHLETVIRGWTTVTTTVTVTTEIPQG
jgi:hypothetical protein